MGAGHSVQGGEERAGRLGGLPRLQAITEGARRGRGATKLPVNAKRSTPEDWPFIEECLNSLLLFDRLDQTSKRRIASEMYERAVPAGDILIKEGDTGLAASELYVVKTGEFEVLEMRHNVNMRVNMKKAGNCFGEVSLLYSCPRSATVAATVDSTVWVLDRTVFRFHVREVDVENEAEVFLNSVPLFAGLTREEKTLIVNALQEESYDRGQWVIRQGELGDKFYVIKQGEAIVYQETSQGSRKVNHLFKADFFGERALLTDEPRGASVQADTAMTIFTISRERFRAVLGTSAQLEKIMAAEKSPAVVTTRLMRLQAKGMPPHMPATVLLKRRRKGRGPNDTWEVVRAQGHVDEVQALRASPPPGEARPDSDALVLTEGAVLGGGAFSRVSIVTEETQQRLYAMKRMRKSAVVQCPEHVFCEQAITRNTAHMFCIRQYASFQDKYHLYMLFDLMMGGDLMDVLVAEAKVIRRRDPQGGWKRGCLAPKAKMLKGMDEHLAKFYIGSIVLALEYLHDNGIIYRDLKPENVFIDQQGFVKLGDFGFAKVLEKGKRTYTFCGTPGYVAPENVIAQGYNNSVDWWGLGVLLYVLLTGRQPFSSPKTDDPMVVMRRIVNENWNIKYPPYLSAGAKDLIARLLERKPSRRLGMGPGAAEDVRRHRWFDTLDWEALHARKLDPPRKPKDDSAKRLKDLVDSERKAKREPKDTPEELHECEMVFAAF